MFFSFWCCPVIILWFSLVIKILKNVKKEMIGDVLTKLNLDTVISQPSCSLQECFQV